MRRRVTYILVGAAVLGFAAVGVAQSDSQGMDPEGTLEEQLPVGPIRDRHELMESIGANAKKVGKAVKAGDNPTVANAAEKINKASGQIVSLYPEGSLHAKSRAKPEIWKNWAEFTADAQKLQDTSAKLVTVAKDKGDIGAASKAMFDTCKSCHDQFRTPED